MTPLNSSSGVDSSSMGDNSNSNSNSNNSTTTAARRRRIGANTETAVAPEEIADVELWRKFADNFREVQSVLDQNRVLIQQVNENHQSKLPDNLSKNVALIKEINSNISTVASLYSKLSANFVTAFQQRREGGGGGGIKNQSSNRRSQEA